MSKKLASVTSSGQIMLSFKGDQREFLAGGNENAVLKNVIWIRGLKVQLMEMSQ